jgi:restriction system protein
VETFYITKAKDLLKKNNNLNNLNWRDFENLISELLAIDGWNIDPTKLARDGGIDIVSIKNDKRSGGFKVLWQVKRYKKSNHIDVHIIREFGFLITKHRASKGVIVTTGGFTKEALKLVNEHEHDMFILDGKDVESWIYEQRGEEDDGRDLPF